MAQTHDDVLVEMLDCPFGLPNKSRRLCFPFSLGTHGFQVNVTVPLINGTHFSQMQAFRRRYHQTFKLLAALGYEPRTSTSLP